MTSTEPPDWAFDLKREMRAEVNRLAQRLRRLERWRMLSTGAFRKRCEDCGAEPGEPCVSSNGKPITFASTHKCRREG